jgi:hypothetical protein
MIRYSRIRQRSALSKRFSRTINIFLFVWNIVGLSIADKIADGCSEHLRPMILATSILGLLLDVVVVCVGVMCLPCVVLLAAKLLRPVGARTLSPEELNAGLVEVTYNRPMGQEEPDECVVCQVEYETLEKIMEIKVCHHRYHKACIVPWVSENNTCPLCREIVVPSDALNPVEAV